MSKPFDLFAEFAKFGAEQEMDLGDPEAKAAFVEHTGEMVDRALANPALLHGQRTEAMFGALLVSLGEIEMLKPEDAGSFFSKIEMVAPDFRVVLKDGRQWLIEVKNVYIREPGQQERELMNADYRAKLEAYANATGGELKLAVFWARWGVWTLVTPERLVDESGVLTLNMLDAMKVNELSELGDRSIGTGPPRKLQLTADPNKARSLADDGSVQFTIGGVRMFSDETEITDPGEQQIAWVLMMHGQWEETEPQAILDGDTLEAIEFAWEPSQRENQDFEFVGTLSRMFARYYAEMTVRDDEVIQLQAPPKLEWFAPLVSSDYMGEQLPLWRVIQRPNYERG